MLAFLSFVLQLSIAAPAPPLSVTYATKRGATHWYDVATVHADGTWWAGPNNGTLTPAELASFMRLLTQVEPSERTALCRARPFRHERLTITRDGVDVVFGESQPCGEEFAEGTRRVVDRILGLTKLSAAPVLFALAKAPVRGDQGWSPITTVWADGRWERRQGGGPEATSGALSAQALTDLEALIAATKLVNADAAGPTCEAMPMVRSRVTLGRNSVTWTSPCGSEPDDSVHDLVRYVGALTAERSVVFARASSRNGGRTWSDELVLMSDGTWTHHGSTGQLAPAALADVKAITEREVDTGPIVSCKAVSPDLVRYTFLRHGRLVAFTSQVSLCPSMPPWVEELARKVQARMHPRLP